MLRFPRPVVAPEGGNREARCILEVADGEVDPSVAHGYGIRNAFHAPEASALVVTLCPARDTVTSSPGAAVPQTGTGFCCWRTMPSPKILDSVASARDACGASRRMRERAAEKAEN